MKNMPEIACTHAKELRPCGTRAAYIRHKRNNETPCQPCIEAERSYHLARYHRLSEDEKRKYAARSTEYARKRRVKVTEIHVCLRCWGTWSRPTTKGQRPKHCPGCRNYQPAWIPRPVRRSVYERDNWVCQICHEPVDAELIGSRSIWRPSIDHIVTRSAGGSDEPENLRLAHFWCNGVLNDGRAYSEADFRLN